MSDKKNNITTAWLMDFLYQLVFNKSTVEMMDESFNEWEMSVREANEGNYHATMAYYMSDEAKQKFQKPLNLVIGLIEANVFADIFTTEEDITSYLGLAPKESFEYHGAIWKWQTEENTDNE